MIRIMSRKIFGSTVASLLMIAAAYAEPAMWVIKDADSTIYLIGTMHLLKHDTEWNAEKVKKTVHDSTELWLEVADFDDQSALLALVSKLGMDAEHPLSSKLNDEQKQKLAKIASVFGVPAATLEPMRPWMAAFLLAEMQFLKAGYDPKAGVERMLKAQAVAEGDKVRGFETAEEQLRMLADLSEADEVAFLATMLDDLDKGMGLVEELAQAWMKGDTDTIARLADEEIKRDAPQVYQKLIVQRNIAWSEKIAEMLKGSGVQQIAVGAAHLAGPDSVQAQLAKRGIRAERY
jgi:uncharacterized protein YbaP (TraB family)